jgi:hypothetical protein
MGGWVDPRSGVDDVEKRKFLTLSGLELRTLILNNIYKLISQKTV